MVTPSDRIKPKAFLSYSQTSPDYIERVVRLAEELTSHGVLVVFDQWDLREGQDLHSFMEQAVGDETVTHVLILCDPLYAEKANVRRGGVGTETLILSPDVYRDVRQERVVPVIMERDDVGNAKVPRYLDGRAYIDMSSEEREAEGYEQLVRMLYNQRARTRPPLGRPPAFLDDEEVPLATRGPARVARTALTGHRPDMAGRLADYLDRLAEAIAAEEIKDVPEGVAQLIDGVFSSIEKLRPYRDEYLEICRAAARYGGPRVDLYDRLHDFFEKLATVRMQHEQRRFDYTHETENLGFIAWELFLYTTAILIREHQFQGLERLLRPFNVKSRYHAGGVTALDILEPQMPLHKRHWPNWFEPAAHGLRERTDAGVVEFESLMEADLLLWFRDATSPHVPGRWYPKTLVYAEVPRSFPLFVRIRLQAEFAHVAPALGVSTRAEFIRLVREVPEDRFFRVGFAMGCRGAYEQLLGIEQGE